MLITIRYEGGAERCWCWDEDAPSHDAWLARVRADLADEPEWCSYEFVSDVIGQALWIEIEPGYKRAQASLEWADGTLSLRAMQCAQAYDFGVETWVDVELEDLHDELQAVVDERVRKLQPQDLVDAFAVVEGLTSDVPIAYRHGGEVK